MWLKTVWMLFLIFGRSSTWESSCTWSILWGSETCICLGLYYQVIHVCIDNYMIYWRADENQKKCNFCQKPLYQDTSRRVQVPYKRMWYLMLTKRLKRLYFSKRTTDPMRWHAKLSTCDEITHPWDEEAWNHFQ